MSFPVSEPGTVSETTGLAILGAGPTGLEAALGAAQAGYPFLLFEAGSVVASGVESWQHVRLFSPWSMNVSPRARAALSETGSEPPNTDLCPTGGQLIEAVLRPLAELPQIAPFLRLDCRVVGVSRAGLRKEDEIFSGRRAEHPFRLLVHAGRDERVVFARSVLDCTGTLAQPNPLGDGGLPAVGERSLSHRIEHRIPVPEDLARYSGRRVLLVGSGHSAQTAARELMAAEAPPRRVDWILRRDPPPIVALEGDPLPERASLARRACELLNGADDRLVAHSGWVVDSLRQTGAAGSGTIRVSLTSTTAPGSAKELEVDILLCLTGSRGDGSIFRELQAHTCWATEGPIQLAASLLGEGSADCLNQTAQGVEALLHPEPDFFILGSKSYGRNNTFLMRVGWQQVEQVMAWYEQSAVSPFADIDPAVVASS